MPRFALPRFALVAAAASLALAMPAFAGPAFAQDAAIAGDAAKGERVFKRCMACHTVVEGGPNRVGPNLYGIVGAPFGHAADYKYSANLLELKDEGRVWDTATLDAYLKKPKDLIPKGIMSFVGLPRESDRADVIAYLATFGGAPAE